MKKIALIILLAALILVAGCAKKAAQDKSVVDSGNAPEIKQVEPGKTCSSLGGDICSAGENCGGEFLESSDSFSCCSESCVAREQKSFSTFDFGQENQALGSVGK
ncbi:hypothetical protein HY638_02080 [Candidatus Woesearchaeota archaeon]|nr:hypothetical protein [Candidatus Woesearchaeota archaeon]